MIDPLPITPIEGPVDADVALPGSKSITNRALVCASLARGRSVLRGALIADDTLAMVGALRELGCSIDVDGTTITVDGVDGRYPRGGVTLDAGLSGTTARFLMAVAHRSSGPVTVDGGVPLRRRPMSHGVEALRGMGRQVDSVDGQLPVVVHPSGTDPEHVQVSGEASSQFLTGLLLAAPVGSGEQRVEVSGPLRSSGYVSMTVKVMERFGASVTSGPDGRDFTVTSGGYVGTDLDIEPDASAASYAFAAAALLGGRVGVPGLGTESIQGDVAFVDVLESMGADVRRRPAMIEVTGSGALAGVEVDMGAISDTAQTLACLAPFADARTRISGIGFIRRKETDRVGAVVAELHRLGVVAVEEEDGLVVEPGSPGPGVVRTYDDHRMAMSFALIGLRSEGVSIADPGCVSKTFPGYWDLLDELRRSGG